METLSRLRKQMEIDFLKTKTYEEINDMFNQLNEKLNFTKIELEQLKLINIDNEKQLIKNFWEYFDKESVAVNCNDQERDEVINDFLKKK